MSVEELRREWVSDAIKAVMKFPDDALDFIESEVMAVKKTSSKNVVLDFANGYSLPTERAILCTGLGPERDLTSAGVIFLNYPSGARVTLDEATTALMAASKPSTYRGKSALMYGGGATSAWSTELAIANGVKDLRWLSADPNGDGFNTANPAGRNDEVMRLTKGLRRQGKLKTVQYMGDASSGSGLEAVINLYGKGKSDNWEADLIIAALGSNPSAPTGILSMLGPILYQDLQPLHRSGGFFARDSDASLIVTSPPLSFDQRYAQDFERVLANLPEEARVRGGILEARLSAGAMADFIASEEEL
jgi:hypothetical protein